MLEYNKYNKPATDSVSCKARHILKVIDEFLLQTITKSYPCGGPAPIVASQNPISPFDLALSFHINRYVKYRYKARVKYEELNLALKLSLLGIGWKERKRVIVKTFRKDV